MAGDMERDEFGRPFGAPRRIVSAVAVDTDARPPRRPPDDICNIVWLVGGGDVVVGVVGKSGTQSIEQFPHNVRLRARAPPRRRQGARERARESDFLLLNMVDDWLRE